MYVFCVWTPGVRHTAPARPVPPVHINRHHYTSKHSRKSTARAAPAQKYPGYNRAQAAAAAEPYGWFYMCSSLQGSSAPARAACFFADLRGVVSAPARGSFSFLFSALCFSGEGEKPLLQRRCFSLSSSTAGLPRCFAHGLIFRCSSLRGSSAYARAACFFAGLRGAVSAPAHGSFSFLFSALCFSGEGEKPLLQRRCFSPSPAPSRSSSTAGLPRCFAHGLIFRCSSLRGSSACARAACFLCCSLRGSSAYARAACFFAGLRGAVSAPARGSAAVCKLRESGQFTNGYQISRLKNNNLPMAHFTFADGKILFCRLSDMNFADGQRRTCRLQIFSLPSANETFAIGKCLAGRRQISYRINGKLLVCHRQIFCLPPANFLFAIQPQICGCVPAACRAAASSSTGEEEGGRGGKTQYRE